MQVDVKTVYNSFYFSTNACIIQLFSQTGASLAHHVLFLVGYHWLVPVLHHVHVTSGSTYLLVCEDGYAQANCCPWHVVRKGGRLIRESGPGLWAPALPRHLGALVLP